MNKKMTLFFTSVMLYIVFLTPLFEWDIKIEALMALVIIQILWIGRVFPLAYSSLLLIVMLSFNFFTFEETMSYFGTGIVWLLFSTFILSSAFIETGLASRISLGMLRLSKGSGRLLIFISFILMFVLSLFVPSNVGKASLVTSVLDRISKSMEKIKAVPNISRGLFIGISFIVAISGAFVATGAGSTIYAYGMFEQLTEEMNYVNWMIYFGPPILVFIVILWLIFLFIFPPENTEKQIILDLIDSRLQEMGKISKNEYKMIAIIGLTLLLWITEGLHGYSVPLIGMLSATLTVMPYVGVWEWDRAKKNIDWDMVIFFACTLLLSNMLIETGTIEWLAGHLVDFFAGHSPIFVLVVLVISTALIRIIFVNLIGFMTIMIPLAITVGQNLNGFSPLVIAMAVFLTGIPGFLLITQSPVHLISYSFGYFTEKDLLRVGVIAMVFWLALVFCSVFFYWRFVV